MPKTIIPKSEQVQKNWLVIDAQDQVLGRLASEVAKLLIGKTKPEFTKHLDLGEYIVVINAEKIRVTGNKEKGKKFYHHTGYPGGLKSISLEKLRDDNPEKLFRNTVWGMLPKNRLGKVRLSHLHVYRGTEHPHTSQKPEKFLVS